MSPAISTSRSVRRHAPHALALAGLLLSGCSGPANVLQVGVEDQASNVIVDTAASTTPDSVPLPPTYAPLAPTATGVPSSVGTDPVPDDVVTVTAARAACPSRDLLAPLAVPAGTGMPLPPAPGSYPYRTRLVTPHGKSATSRTVTIVRTVTNVQRAIDAAGHVTYQYDVIVPEPDGSGRTITGYRIVPVDRTGTPQPTVGPDAPGLYVTDVTSEHRTGSASTTSTFTPNPPMELLPLPVVPGQTFDVLSTDGSTAVAYRGTVGNRSIFNACGKPVQAVVVDLDGSANLHVTENLNPYIDQIKKCIGVSGLACAQDVFTLCPPSVPCPPFPALPPTPPLPSTVTVTDPAGGRQLSPSGQSSFLASYALAPQYGGISLYDKIVTSTLSTPSTVLGSRESTINTVPNPARQPST